jgi:hypothetical protein
MATNTNPIRYINPIDLGGNELLNFLPEKLDAAPLSPDTGRMYYNTVDNKAYLWNGTAWRDIGSAPSISNVTVDNTHATLAAYVAAGYDAAAFDEGDLLVLATATDPAERVWVNLGTNVGDASDFVALSIAYDETEIKAMFSAGDGLEYADGVFSVADASITEAMLATAVAAKLNRGGITYSLSDAGVSGVTYSNGVFTITHNLGTQAVAVVMRDSLDDYKQIPVSNDAPDGNTVRVYFAEQPTNDQYKVTIVPMII